MRLYLKNDGKVHWNVHHWIATRKARGGLSCFIPNLSCRRKQQHLCALPAWGRLGYPRVAGGLLHIPREHTGLWSIEIYVENRKKKKIITESSHWPINKNVVRWPFPGTIKKKKKAYGLLDFCKSLGKQEGKQEKEKQGSVWGAQLAASPERPWQCQQSKTATITWALPVPPLWSPPVTLSHEKFAPLHPLFVYWHCEITDPQSSLLPHQTWNYLGWKNPPSTNLTLPSTALNLVHKCHFYMGFKIIR